MFVCTDVDSSSSLIAQFLECIGSKNAFSYSCQFTIVLITNSVEMYAVPIAQAVSNHKNPRTTLKTVINVGKNNGLKPWWQTLLLAWHGGVFIAFGAGVGLALAGTLDTMNLTGGWSNADGSTSPVELHLSIPVAFQRFAIGATFSFALTSIVLTGSELFTGNVMFVTASKWAQQLTWPNLLKNMVFSLLGNICGCLTVAYFLFHLTSLYETESIKSLVLGNAHKLVFEGTFGENILKGVGDNYLVCLALWSANSTDSVLAKMVAMWWPVMAFVCIGFEHSIATSFFVPIAIMNGAPITINQYIGRSLVPVAIGNIIGGIIFTSTQYWLIRPEDATAVVDPDSEAGEKRSRMTSLFVFLNNLKPSKAPTPDMSESVPTEEDIAEQV